MAKNAPRCPTMVGTYLEVIGCLGATVVVLLGGRHGLQNCGWFCDGFGPSDVDT